MLVYSPIKISVVPEMSFNIRSSLNFLNIA